VARHGRGKPARAHHPWRPAPSTELGHRGSCHCVESSRFLGMRAARPTRERGILRAGLAARASRPAGTRPPDAAQTCIGAPRRSARSGQDAAVRGGGDTRGGGNLEGAGPLRRDPRLARLQPAQRRSAGAVGSDGRPRTLSPSLAPLLSRTLAPPWLSRAEPTFNVNAAAVQRESRAEPGRSR
jgi:hypothetical protein